MCADLTPVISATTRWLLRAYPAPGGPLATVLAEAQARQAVTVAAWLRYPTAMDAALLTLSGPGGSGRLDWITGTDSAMAADGEDAPDGAADAWRSWVDEAVASWAACLLSSPSLAEQAVSVLADCEQAPSPSGFRRLLAPDEHDRRAAALLRHPDLLAPIAELHRSQLVDRLFPDPVGTD
ncbi:hypothetical protein [Streptomyces aidingensis]|uniref:Uncharacterized protein n=1 Tax=Streptomyces aidingensis TaxID=910347 RepID=A0A1I1MHX4_9ACTN|nr:hypothetical protein [Streptomyces aidingensis]SFC84432.1 hypothetical protein SAMN05421773_106247 [Streptomyces aidingensis]